MDCPDCGRTNRSGAKFCAGCATPLIAACTACGHQLAPEAKFCDECGHPVGGPAPPRTESEAIRKTVTVMFCDLVGSTSFGERVDTESVRETLGRYHSMVQRMVDDRGGTVAKFIGDGVMNVFGVPEVAEDDAERAVATGLELQRGFAAIRSVVKDRFGIELGMRVGINTGEVIISDDDSDLVGDVLNTAARLEAACEPGSVLVGEDTWRLTRSTIRYETLGEIELKGKSDGVAAFRAVDEAAVDHDSTTPFVGRDVELRALLAIIDEAVASREVRLATVIGAPGVGKTRLAEELRKTYVGDATFVDIRIERTGGTTFSPIADLLRIAAGLDDARSHDEVLHRIRALVGNLDDADRVASLLASFVGAAEMRSTEELFFAVRRMLEAVGETRSIVVVVDDVQWAEPLLLDLLEHLAEWVHDSPAVMLALARPELREIRPALAERGRRVSASISLEGLDADATAELAARLVGATALPPELLDRLPESTEGNPLFVRELMRMLIDDKVIVEGDQGWELAIDAEAVEVPPTIQSLLSSRIERLPGNERRLLERASVVGADFPLGAVAALTPQGDAGRLIPILERLRRKELVEPTGVYWGNEPIFRFHHALIRDASYRRLLKRTRADHHLTVATWMTGSGGDVSGEHEVAIGYHLEQAHDLRIQLNIHDDDTAEIGARAAETLGAAAERALERDDVAAASSLAARAVALLDEESPELPDLLMLGCEAFFAFGDVSAGLPLLKQLEDRTGDDERLSAWVYAFRAQLRMLTEPDRLVEAEVSAATAAEALALLDDRTGEANARLVRAGALARLGHIGDCEAELDKALTAARAADDGRRVATVLGAAPVAALWGPSPVPRAGGRCLDVLRLLRITTGSPRVEATSTRCQAVLEALRGRFDTARSMLADTRTSVEKLGDRHGLLETQLYWGIVELLAGEPEAAEPHLRAAYGGLGRLGIGADAGQAAAHLSRALMLQGRLDEAAELAADSEALAGQNPQTAIAAKAARADLLAEQGDLDEARQVAETAVAIAEGTDILVDHANANLVLARVCSMAGDADGTRAAVEEAQRLFDAKGASVTIDIEVPNEPDPTPIAGMELFDADDLDEATRPFEELTDPPSQPRSDSDHGEEVPVEPEHPAVHEPWNTADRLLREGMWNFEHDHDAWRRQWDPGIEYHDRRSSVGDVVLHGVEQIEASFPLGTIVPADTETIATRGEKLVLYRSTMRPTGSMPGERSDVPLQFLGINRVGPSGKLDQASFFDADALDDALAGLDELFLDGHASALEAFAVRFWNDAYATNRRPLDVDRGLAFHHPRFRMTDHRAASWPEQGLDGLRTRFESIDQLDGDPRMYLVRLLGVAGQSWLFEARVGTELPDGTIRAVPSILLTTFDPDTGLNVATEQFAPDASDETLARLHDAVGSDLLVNVASLVVNRAHMWHRSGRWELMAGYLAPDVEVAPSAGGPAVNPDELLDPEVARTVRFGAAHRRVLAVRDDNLALMEWAWEADSEAPDRCFAVVELDELARLSEVRLFDWDVDSLTDATDLLEARWMETGDHDDIDVSTIEAIAAWRHGDPATLQRILHEDFQVVDHRLFSWGDYTKETFISLFDNEARNVVVEVPAIYLGGSGSGRVYQLTAWGFSDDEMIEALHGHFVIVHRDGQVLRCDGHEIDTPDESIARLHELQVELGDVVEEEGEETSEGDRPWNRADALSRELLGFMAVGEVDEHRLLLAEDVVLDDRRTGIASRIVGRVDAVTVTMPGIYSDDVEVVLDIEPVAARQDDLVLHHCTIRQADGHGAHMEWLNVSSWRDGQLELALQLDPHDYPAAVTELDRLFLERANDPAVHRRVRAWASSLGAISRGDVAGGTAYGDEGFEWIDHRPIGWGVLDQDGMENRFTSLEELPGRRVAYVARFGEAEGPVEWVESHLRLSGGDGSDQVDVQVLVNALDPSSGLMLCTHQYATDQVSEATEKFAELANSARSHGDLWNAAVAVGGSVSSWIRRADMKRARSWTSPDLSLVDVKGNRHRLQIIDLDEPSALRRHGLGLDHRRVLAIRGERLALTELRDGEASPSIHHLAIEEVGADARLVSITLFTPDSLADAVRHLERQWLTIETPRSAEVLDLHARLVHAYSVNDGAALESILTSDATFTDHRELGFGHVDRDWILESSELNHAVATAPVDARYLEWNEHGVLGWMLPWQLEEDGRLVQAGVSAYSIMHVVDGRVAAVEFHPDGQLDAARTRFDELTSPTGSSGNPSSKPSWAPADPDRT